MKNVLPLIAGLAFSASSFIAHAEEPALKAAASPSSQTTDLLKQPTLYVVGYAHLDTQWRWTYVDTIKDYIPKTLNDNFKLFDKYPNYVFNFSGSRRYQMMKEYYPKDYEKLKQYVAAGRWFPCGSSVDENDANVPSAESYVRHILYGNKFFRHEFGVASEEYMLPDCFGFPASMPTLLAHCGLKGFSTQKLTWNAVVPIPFKVGVWEGPDGSSVGAAFDPGAYVGEVKENLANSEAWLKRINTSAKTSGVFADYHYFGTGDTGGSPTERSVAKVEESVGTQGKIKIISGPADALFKDLTPDLKARLPKYKGELMLTEHSAGSITSQAHMKRWNRKNELLADAAERASLAAWWLGARPYPADKLEDAWYLVLGSQMHDILPGTSVPKAYEFSWNDELLAANRFGETLTDAASAVISGLDTRGVGETIVVYNPLSWEREDIVEASVPAVGTFANAKGVLVTGPDLMAVPAQVLSVANGVARIAFVAKMPSVSFATYTVELEAKAVGESSLKVSDHQLENDHYVVKIDANGDVSSILDKKAKKELLASPIRLGLHYENPRQWPAWNQDWNDRKLAPKAFAANPTSIRVVENGPARVAVEIVQHAEGSTFTQQVRLSAGDAGARVEFATDIDWRTRQRSLRVHFPLTVSNPKATYDLAAGALERGNGHEKQYEYSFHHWFDLTDSKKDYGVTAISDCKYGADKPSDNTVRLTLLHTPGTQGGYPDQGTQDLGKHHVLYALHGHTGDWTQSSGPAQGARLNQPLIAFHADQHEGSLGRSFSLMSISNPKVSISAAKRAEAGDEVIIRLREHAGENAKDVRVALAAPIVSAREVDGQERPLADAAVREGALVTDIHGFGLKAFAVKLGKPKSSLSALQSKPVALAFDTDVASTASKPTDGVMDADGRSYPGAMLPASLTLEGMTFSLGATTDGQKNALACNAQEIQIPEGGYDRLYLLAAADGDTTSTIQVGGKSTSWNVQNWRGYIGQWDNRLWPHTITEASEGDGGIVGLVPGYVKSDAVAWYASHYQTTAGNTFYDYCYIYKYAIDLPAGTKSITLPKNANIKVFAMTAAKTPGGLSARVSPANPLFDTLSNHRQDAPSIAPAGGTFSDATQIRIEPGLYWQPGAIRYTLDGSAPSAQSPAYTGPITLSKSTTIKTAILGADGKLSDAASASFEINDTTAPSVLRAEGVYESPTVRVQFSEPLADASATASNFVLDPVIAVTKAELQPDKRTILLTVAKAPELGKPHKITISGVKDSAPAGNAVKNAVANFTVAGPVFSLAQIKPEQKGTIIRDVPGLPTKAHDKWSMNVFVKMSAQPPNRTILAGFGSCTDSAGKARYLAKFGSGIHFWSSNRDVPTRTAFDLNRWQMITLTYDGSILRIYKDGQRIAEGASALADDENSIAILPQDPWERLRQFDGDVRNFTVWNVALGDEAISALSKDMPE